MKTLSAHEKSYCLALAALSQKKYRQAADHFDKAAPFFDGNKEFILLCESTHLLMAVKKELAEIENEQDAMVITEVFSDGQKTNLPR